MSRKHQAILINNPEGFQKLPPNCLLSLDGDTATAVSENAQKFINFVVDSGSGESTFSVVPFSDAGSYPTDPVAGTNTGDGTISTITCSLTTVTEDWTVTCTDDTTEGSEEWSVTGSVSGLQTAVAVTGVEYTSDSGEVVFTISAGGTAFAVDDSFTFTTTHRASYILANKDCRIIIEGVIARNDSTAVGGVIVIVGDSDGEFGQMVPIFTTGISAAADVLYPSVSSVVTIHAGEAISLKYDGLGDPTYLGLQVSSVFPE